MQDVTPGGGCLATVSGRCRGAQLARKDGGAWEPPVCTEEASPAEGADEVFAFAGDTYQEWAPSGWGQSGLRQREASGANVWGAHGTLLPFLMQCVQVDLKLRVEKLNVKMVPGSAGAGEGPSPPRMPSLPKESKEDREERVLAMLGIVGTILNLLVIIFVYIYTTI